MSALKKFSKDDKTGFRNRVVWCDNRRSLNNLGESSGVSNLGSIQGCGVLSQNMAVNEGMCDHIFDPEHLKLCEAANVATNMASSAVGGAALAGGLSKNPYVAAGGAIISGATSGITTAVNDKESCTAKNVLDHWGDEASDHCPIPAALIANPTLDTAHKFGIVCGNDKDGNEKTPIGHCRDAEKDSDTCYSHWSLGQKSTKGDDPEMPYAHCMWNDRFNSCTANSTQPCNFVRSMYNQTDPLDLWNLQQAHGGKYVECDYDTEYNSYIEQCPEISPEGVDNRPLPVACSPRAGRDTGDGGYDYDKCSNTIYCGETDSGSDHICSDNVDNISLNYMYLNDDEIAQCPCEFDPNPQYSEEDHWYKNGYYRTCTRKPEHVDPTCSGIRTD